LTAPLPDPFTPLSIVIHAALLTADHPHPAPVATFTVALLANCCNFASEGDSEYEHATFPC
jgi:hypothetical protein